MTIFRRTWQHQRANADSRIAYLASRYLSPSARASVLTNLGGSYALMAQAQAAQTAYERDPRTVHANSILDASEDAARDSHSLADLRECIQCARRDGYPVIVGGNGAALAVRFKRPESLRGKWRLYVRVGDVQQWLHYGQDFDLWLTQFSALVEAGAEIEHLPPARRAHAGNAEYEHIHAVAARLRALMAEGKTYPVAYRQTVKERS